VLPRQLSHLTRLPTVPTQLTRVPCVSGCTPHPLSDTATHEPYGPGSVVQVHHGLGVPISGPYVKQSRLEPGPCSAGGASELSSVRW